MRICYIIWCFLCVISLSAEAQKGKYFEKNVRFPEKVTLEEKVEMAARLVPTKQQLAWQQLELTAFIHFGINTFTGKERGDGKEFPVMFNPNIMMVFVCGRQKRLVMPSRPLRGKTGKAMWFGN